MYKAELKYIESCNELRQKQNSTIIAKIIYWEQYWVSFALNKRAICRERNREKDTERGTKTGRQGTEWIQIISTTRQADKNSIQEEQGFQIHRTLDVIIKQEFPGSIRCSSLPRWLSGKNPTTMQEMQVQSPGQEDPLEKEMATHSKILTWEIPWTEEPRRLHREPIHRVTKELGMT